MPLIECFIAMGDAVMRDITVNVDLATEAEPAVACALALARRYGALLTGLQIMPPNLLGSFGMPDALSLSDQEATERRAWWRELCRRHEVAGELELPQGAYVPTLARRSLLSDLLVSPLPMDSPQAPTVAGELSRALFAGSAPLLLVPQGYAGNFDFRSIAIGWNGSPEALRAIHAALPLLREADDVTVFDGDRARPPGMPPALPPLPLREWFGRQGIRFHWVGFDPEQDIGPALHGEAQARHAELLVMGAWGRSRMSELVLGGATRWLLAHARMPLLLAH